ncbi:sensor histidine kinase [Fibrella sp. WM1]|uniref:sensor histidine kinase n=1 Tax=Fibrella musci TaxID=3242485 RepID=UPI00352133C3
MSNWYRKIEKGISWSVIRIHIYVWLAYIVYEHLIYFFVLSEVKLYITETLIGFAANAILFYFAALYVYPMFLPSRQYIRLTLYTSCILIGYVIFKVIFKLYILPILGPDWAQPYASKRLLIGETFWRGGYYMLLALGYWFGSHLYVTQKRKLSLEREQRANNLRMIEMEKHLNLLEVDFLKSQLNPHFLFNTLNFFYSRLITQMPQEARGIQLLSSIMRYALQKRTINGKALLTDEVSHLSNYIELQKARFSNSIHVEFTIDGMLDYKLVVPLVLMTLTENCFKHGDLFDAESPVRVTIQTTDEILYFSTVNKKNKVKAKDSNNIGLTNVRKILKDVYNTNHTFTVVDSENRYETRLSINL